MTCRAFITHPDMKAHRVFYVSDTSENIAHLVLLMNIHKIGERADWEARPATVDQFYADADAQGRYLLAGGVRSVLLFLDTLCD